MKQIDPNMLKARGGNYLYECQSQHTLQQALTGLVITRIVNSVRSGSNTYKIQTRKIHKMSNPPLRKLRGLVVVMNFASSFSYLNHEQSVKVNTSSIQTHTDTVCIWVDNYIFLYTTYIVALHRLQYKRDKEFLSQLPQMLLLGNNHPSTLTCN